jgi:hypothetical protein
VTTQSAHLSAGVSVEEVAELPGDVGRGNDVHVRAQRVVGLAVLPGHVPSASVLCTNIFPFIWRIPLMPITVACTVLLVRTM